MNHGSININGKLYNYSYTQNNIHLKNSFEVSKKFFNGAIAKLINKHPELAVWNRSVKSLRREWATHNLCYALGIKRSSTKDVDFNYPQKWYAVAAYTIVGSIALLIIK